MHTYLYENNKGIVAQNLRKTKYSRKSVSEMNKLLRNVRVNSIWKFDSKWTTCESVCAHLIPRGMSLDGPVSHSRHILAGNVNVIIVRSAEAKDLITRSSRFRNSMMRVHRGVSADDVREDRDLSEERTRRVAGRDGRIRQEVGIRGSFINLGIPDVCPVSHGMNLSVL